MVFPAQGSGPSPLFSWSSLMGQVDHVKTISTARVNVIVAVLSPVPSAQSRKETPCWTKLKSGKSSKNGDCGEEEGKNLLSPSVFRFDVFPTQTQNPLSTPNFLYSCHLTSSSFPHNGMEGRAAFTASMCSHASESLNPWCPSSAPVMYLKHPSCGC